MPVFDLSHILRDGMLQYPGDDLPPRIVHTLNHAADGMLCSALAMNCHVGTHIDTPAHFLDGQPGLEAMPVDLFCGAGVVLDAPVAGAPGALGVEVLEGVDLAAVDFVLLRTGWERHWGTPRYYEVWPYLDPSLARRLAAAGLKGVGLDGPSVDPIDAGHAHEILAAAGMINVENLAGLAVVPAGRPFLFHALPLKLEGCEGSPVRAVAIMPEDDASAGESSC